MPHIPEFPPIFNDWKPAPPPFPPIPTFFVNPLTPEQRAALEEEFGPWAAGWTRGMLSPRETYETTRGIAGRMYENFMGRPAPRVREPRERKPREEIAIKELEKALKAKELTPEFESDLSARIIALISKGRRPLSVEYQQTLARSAVSWAGEEGVSLTEEEAARIVKGAIATLRPEVAVRTREGKLLRWETAEGIPLPQELWPTKT